MSTPWWLDNQVATASSPENTNNLVAVSNQIDTSASPSGQISQNSNYMAKKPTTEQSHFDKSSLLHMNSTETDNSGQPLPRHAVPLSAPEEKATGFTWSVPPAWAKHSLRRQQPGVPLQKTEYSSVSMSPMHMETQAPPSRQPKDSDDRVVFKTTTPPTEYRPVASISRLRVESASQKSTTIHPRGGYNLETMTENAPIDLQQAANDVPESPNQETVYGIRKDRSRKPTRYIVPGIVSDEVATSSRPSSARNSSDPADNRFSSRDRGHDLGSSSFVLQPSAHTIQGKRKRDRPQRPTPEYNIVIDSRGTPLRRPDYASSVVRHNVTHSISKPRPLANRAEHRVPSPGNSSTLSDTNRDAKDILEKLNQKHARMYENERAQRERLETVNTELRRKCASQQECIQDQEFRLTGLLQSAASWELEKEKLIQAVNSQNAERIDQESRVLDLRRLLEEEQLKIEEHSEQIKAQEKTMSDLRNDRLGLEAKKAKLHEKAARIKETINEAIREQQELHLRNKMRLEEVICEVRQEAQDMKANVGLALTKTDEVQKRVLNAARAIRQESAVALAERDVTVKHLTDQLLEKDERLAHEQDTVRRLLDDSGKTHAQLQAMETNLATRFSDFLELYEQGKYRLAKDSQRQRDLESNRVNLLAESLAENASHYVIQTEALSGINLKLTESVAPLLQEIGTTIPNQLSHIDTHLELLQTQHSAREDALVIELKECKQGNSVLATTVEEKHNECDRLEAEIYKLQHDLDAKTCENAALKEKVKVGEKQLTCMAEKLTEGEQRLSDAIEKHASETEQCLKRLAESEASSTNNCQRVSSLVIDLGKARNDATQAGQKLYIAQSAWKSQSLAADQRRHELEAQVSEKKDVILELEGKLNMLKARQEQELANDNERLAARKAEKEQDTTTIEHLNAQLEQKEQTVRDAEDRSNSLVNELSEIRKRAAELDQLLAGKVDDVASIQASLDCRTSELQSSEERHQCTAAIVASLESKVSELEVAQQSLGAARELETEWHKWVSALCERLKDWVILKSPTASKIYHQLLKQHGLAGDTQEFVELASVFLAVYQYLKQQVIPNTPGISELALIFKNAEAKRVKLNSPLEVPSTVLVSVQEERNIRRRSVRPVPILRQTQTDMPSTPQPEREQKARCSTNPHTKSFKRRSSFQSNTDNPGLNNVTPDANREGNERNSAVQSVASRGLQPPLQQRSPNKMVTRSRRRLFAPNGHQSQP
ncbi:hypothetical protein MCOR27_008627 [Pyricularia oryzae]|uniref:Uncharacterized protein n=1 Tax=Pyricularia grisea TaxID=148305 RepID=A0ABQ8N7Q9_PYRGI|nr:hypothetical protein MCOR02_008321 [Pyricularia oryzae]KAI6292637.1 hypothetical protein MCOR33_009703 [Pyricularia grisea]KAI6253989.1 hypothetical protein MCOR19_009487 [Pyricularia oryzae]KAI6268456.1 hypothetical protein MCOR26_009208 [Pyricularia oryzae]KAI6271866.1 hypothetical protein MCOR27_008627 [Pyricularia oryzae]